ncbi:MAG: hypothetical protein U0359_02940 [Byssovorax sp.]
MTSTHTLSHIALATIFLSFLAGCGDVTLLPFPSGSSERDTCSAVESCTVVTLADQRPGPSALAVDTTHVYWVDRGGGGGTSAIVRELKAGGEVEVLATGQGNVPSLALDQTHVYWTNLAGPDIDPSLVAVMRVPKEGGDAEALSPVQTNPWGLATAEGQVLWTNLPAGGAATPTGEVWTMPASGGEAMLLASGQKTPISLAVQGGTAYWLNGGSAPGEESAVLAANTSGGEAMTLAEGAFFPLGLSVDESSVYFTNTRTMEGMGNVMKVPVGGGDPAVVAEAQDHPSTVVRSGDHLFWTNAGSADAGSIGAVMKLGDKADKPTVMVDGSTLHPFGLAVDDAHVYWTDGPAGRVLRMDRCCPAK